MINKKTCIKSNPKNNENFNVPSISSAEDVSVGASEIYGWGYTPIKSKHKKHKKEEDKDCPKEEKIVENIQYMTISVNILILQKM